MPDSDTGPLRDRLEPLPMRSAERRFRGRVWDVVSEEVDLGEGGVVTRDFVDHTGAVAVLALDDDDRVVLVQQYRHPVGAFEWELPAGLLDVDGDESIEQAGRRIFEMFLAVASGAQTKSEAQGFGDNEFVPWQIGAVM